MYIFAVDFVIKIGQSYFGILFFKTIIIGKLNNASIFRSVPELR